MLLPDGRPVVRHAAEAGPPAEALRREASLLALGRGPGVIDLVATGDDPEGGAWLSTRYLAGGTLTDLVRAAGEPAATAALARVAGTLADLHDIGIVHGRCTAEHVVGGASGASLCGFSAATAEVMDGLSDPQVDLSAFAALVAVTLTSDADPSRRARRAVAGLTQPPHGTNLRAVAAELWALARDGGWVEPASAAPAGRGTDPLVAGDAGDPPPARPVGRRRRGYGGSSGSSTSRGGQRVGRSTRRALAAATVVGCLVLLGGMLLPTSDDPLPGTTVAAPALRTTTTPAAMPAPERVWPRPATPEVDEPAGSAPVTTGQEEQGSPQPEGPGPGQVPAGGLAPPSSRPEGPATPDGRPEPPPGEAAGPGPTPAPGAEPPHPGGRRPAEAPPPEPVGTGPAPGPDTSTGPGAAGAAVLEHAGIRYAIGDPGDIVVLGDWDCDGTPTPSVVRRADGSVWAFRQWAAGAEVVAAEALGAAPSPVAAASHPEHDGCDVLVITAADGREVVVRPG